MAMRTLGPGSVSSLLKVILDVVWFLLWASAAAVTLLMIAVLLLSFNPALIGDQATLDHFHIQGRWLGPLAAAILLGADLYFAGTLIIVGRLRLIFRTLIVGDPFHPANVARLRMIGAALAALEIGRYTAAGVFHIMLPQDSRALSGGVHLTVWFSVLVIVVLAEVFREGARLRSEAELTI
jgi:hypothetical protein